MSHEQRPRKIDQKTPAPTNGGKDSQLTQAQREFAKVLGQILARRWQNRLEEKDVTTRPHEN